MLTRASNGLLFSSVALMLLERAGDFALDWRIWVGIFGIQAVLIAGEIINRPRKR